MSKKKKLVEEVNDLVKDAGGWFNVIARLTNTFDSALDRIGTNVDCPFAARHRNGGGLLGFRFSEDSRFEGRAICSCMQDKGVSPVDLLMMDGVGGGSFVGVMHEIKKAYAGANAQEYKRRETTPVIRRPAPMTREKMLLRKENLTIIAKGLISLIDVAAHPGREYFRKRGIPLGPYLADVKFHPSLEYFEEQGKGRNKVKVSKGFHPAIVSAFRGVNGRVVNFHRIYITADGDKLGGVDEVKKITSPLPGFKGSSIAVATVPGCRTLHVTEGVEKAWAIHLATGESVKAAYSCGALKSLVVDKEQYDRVVIWSDNDPAIPGRNRDYGDGQYFAGMLFQRLRDEGFEVGFMLPQKPLPEGQAEGRDWEDVIVGELILDLAQKHRFNSLTQYAVRGGVFHGFALSVAA